jgi:hypothetical protein
MNFQPTYLYIKQHALTGKCYFGKTISNDVVKYTGSGKYWLRHIKIHGKEHVVTLWYDIFTNKDECTKFALEFSEKLNIVKSDQWLNLINENGLDGGDNFSSMSEEKYLVACNKMKLSSPRAVPHLKGKTLEQINGVKRAKELKELRSINSKGSKNGMYGKTHTKEVKDICAKIASLKFKDKTYEEIMGQTKALEMKQLRSDSMKLIRSSQTKLTCPHCGKIGSRQNMHRWHFNNCKRLAL